ncbi:hypothetical protein ACEZ3G_08150 [Maribacter algicola]|uniref:Uncharacterized protein n=1 Tax=Meishania litoralis TaxID=3434685 RepID=A0ACC7LK73_9FLAO
MVLFFYVLTLAQTKKMSRPKIKCKYKFAEEYNPEYVNGAHGGVTPKGEIAINFFMERHAIPYSQTYEVDEDGLLTREIKDEAEPKDLNTSFIRYIKTGIIVDYSTAKSIYQWLGNHIDKIEEGILNNVKDDAKP